MNVTNLTSFVVRTDTISAYMAAINKIPVLTAQEEKDLFAKYEGLKETEQLCKDILNTFKTDETIEGYRRELEKTQQEMIDVRNEIITRNLRFNFAVAKRYNNGDLLPDLINVGTIGMYEAFEKFDWREDIRFCSFAVWHIRRAINAYLNKENLLVRPKNNVRIAPKVRKIENDFYLKNGRKPYPIEVIEILRKDYGIDVKDEIDIYGATVDRIDSPIGDDEDFTVEDSQAFNEKTSVDNEYDMAVNTDEMSYHVEQLMKTLTDRERVIICMAYGYGGYNREYKDKEIGEKLGLTSERVRQLRNGALKKMRAAHVVTAD